MLLQTPPPFPIIVPGVAGLFKDSAFVRAGPFPQPLIAFTLIVPPV